MAKGEEALARMTEQRGQLVQHLLEAMETDGLSWTKGWISCPPVNADGKRYRGMNRMWLSYVAMAMGYDDPRWYAIGSIKKNKWHIPAGTKASAYVEYWEEKFATKKDSQGNAVLDENGDEIKIKYPKLISMTAVWNASVLEGPEPYENRLALPSGDYGLADDLNVYFANGGPKYVESTACVQAGWSPGADRIEMPSRKLFHSAENFVSTLAHESIHSTAHKKRLDRPYTLLFGTEKYAVEELVAEIGAMILTADAGYNYEPDTIMLDNHAAYLQSWVQALKEKDSDKWLADVVQQATRAAEYIEKKFSREGGEVNA